MNKEELMQEAIEVFGPEAQRRMGMEECSELIQALCKYERDPGPDAEMDVVEEMVDVGLMLEQLRSMFPMFTRHAARIEAEKLARLAALLGEV